MMDRRRWRRLPLYVKTMKRVQTHPGEILALDYLGPLDVNARIGVVNRNTAERTRPESADIET
jgi:hypothetical protein